MEHYPKTLSLEAVCNYVEQLQKQAHQEQGVALRKVNSCAFDLTEVEGDVDFALVQLPLKVFDVETIRKAQSQHDEGLNLSLKYADLKTAFPPIVVDNCFRIIDGNHRIVAAAERGDEFILTYLQVYTFRQ